MFLRPFILDGLNKLQPAGAYIVDTEEELIETISFPAWRRIGTVIRIANPGVTEYLPVDPEQLHEALVRDGAQQDPSSPVSDAPKARRAARLMRQKKLQESK